MSKKTKAAQKRKTKRDLFHDPIFMHHMLSCVYRSLELAVPGEVEKIRAKFLEHDLITPELDVQSGECEGGRE